jgi:ABC-type antimicrobial peptide transport system permease subunit
MNQDVSAANYPIFLLRTATDTASVLKAVRRVFQRIDASLSIQSAHSFEEQIAPLTVQDRSMAQLAVVFGMTALTLAAIGCYGVLSYNVARRTGEIAVRMALGAQPGRIIGMILRETGPLVIIGVIVGTTMSYAASHLIQSQLFGVPPQDSATFLVAVTVLLFVTLIAAFLPAWRASHLTPMAALRSE